MQNSNTPIYYLSREKHNYTMRLYLENWGQNFIGKIKLIPYEHLFSLEALTPGVYIFSDIDRLTGSQKHILAGVWDKLNSGGKGFKVFNHPLKTLNRYELLKKLYKEGDNRFRVFKIHEIPEKIENPIFIRGISDHTGSFTQLVDNHEDLDEIIGTLLMSGYDPDNLIALEFYETAGKDGIYRKYSSFVVGNQVIPRDLIFSQRWIQKYPDLLDKEFLEEEKEYLLNNPHKEEILKIFKKANTEYGRIDYSLLNGKLQVWEINTNSIIMLPRDKYDKKHIPAQLIFQKAIKAAFESISVDIMNTSPLEINFNRTTINSIINQTI
jgi:hypothetical protein